MAEAKVTETNESIERMFKAGAHFGYSKSRRHPSVKPLIFGAKNKVEIFDLEKTKIILNTSSRFVNQFPRITAWFSLLVAKTKP
jgi:ribosomal protein S2